MPLYATLPPNDVKQLRTIIQNSTVLPSISPKALFNEIQNNGTHSHYFPPLNNLFNFLFGDNNQTNTIQTCLENLNLCLPNFVNHPFPSYQIFALTSLMQATNNQPPSTLQTSIAYMLESNNPPSIYDLAPMMVICEYSNRKFGLDLQNILLEIGAVFHGNANATNLDVHLPYRQEQRLLAANPDKEIPIFGGPVKWGIPIGEFQDDFEGFSEVVTVPSMNPDAFINDVVIFGTPNEDHLNPSNNFPYPQRINAVIYGGTKNDKIMAFDPNSQSPKLDFVYLAGNQGNDQYQLTNLQEGNTGIGIFDSDHQGQIQISWYHDGGALYQNQIFSGPIIDQFLYSAYGQYAAQLTPNVLQLDNGYTKIKLFNFKFPDFEILPNTDSHHPIDMGKAFTPNTAAAITERRIAFAPQYNYQGGIYIYGHNGTLEAQINLRPQGRSAWQSFSLAENAQGDFHIAGIAQKNCTLTYTVIDAKSLLPTTYIIDQAISSSTCDASMAFPYLTLTPTDATNKNLAFVYLKQKSPPQNIYGLHVYIFGKKNIELDIIKIAEPMSLRAGPTNEGFLISNAPSVFFEEHPYSDIYKLNPSGNLLEKFRLPEIAIIASSTLNKKNVVLYQNLTRPCCIAPNWFTAFLENGKLTNSLELPIATDIASYPSYLNKFSWPKLLALPNEGIQILSGFGSYFDNFGSFFISPNNTLTAGKFFLTGNGEGNQIGAFRSSLDGFGAKLLPDGNTFITYTNTYSFAPDYAKQHLVTLSTSYLSQQPQPKIVIAKSTLATTVSTTTVQTTSPAPLFDSGNWDSEIKHDLQTGEPIFTYQVFDSTGRIIGEAEFYGQPLLCTGKDGNGHNLIKTTGVLRDFKIQPEMNIEEVCRVLPPTLFESTVMKIQKGAYEGMQQGAMRGGANVFGYTLRSTGVSEKVAGYLAELTYYSGFFLLRFNSYLIEADYLSAMLQAAIDTGNLLLISAVIQTTSSLLDYTGNQLSQTYKEAGNLVKGASALIGRLGIFAWNAIRQDPIETTAQIITGALTQTAVETVGTYVVDQFKPQETTYSPSTP